MKMHPSLLALAAMIAFALTGCVNSTTTITVAKDGSGTVTERSLVGAEFSQMMKQLTDGLGDLLGGAAKGSIPANPVLLSDADYKARAGAIGEGVTFDSSKELKEADGSIGALVVYRFEDVSKIRVSPDDSMSTLESLKSALPIQVSGTPDLPKSGSDPVTFTFEPGSVTTLNIKLPKPDEEQMREASSQADEIKTPSDAELAQARQALGDMAFSLQVIVEGEVVESDATHQEGNTATLFEMDFGEILDDPEAFAKIKSLGDQKDFDKAKDTLQDVKGMKFESKETVKIRFK